MKINSPTGGMTLHNIERVVQNLPPIKIIDSTIDNFDSNNLALVLFRYL